jgi:hypothetical protein
LTYYSTPLPKTLLRPRRKLWDEYRGNNELTGLIYSLNAIADANPIAPLTPVAAGDIETV